MGAGATVAMAVERRSTTQKVSHAAANAHSPALVFLAAGPAQSSILEQLARSPFAIIAVDRNAAAPGFAFADERIIASIADAALIEASLVHLTRRYEFRGVLSGSHGDALVTAARLARTLGVSATDESVIQIVRDKVAFSAACESLGCQVPRRGVARACDDVAWHTLAYPLVIRPTKTVVGKDGILKVHDPHEAAARCGEALRRSASLEVELVEYVSGTDVVVVGAIGADEPHVLTLVDECNRFDERGLLRGDGLRVPSVYVGTPLWDRIAAFARALVSGLGLRHTPFALALRVDQNGQPWPIEMHVQLGGDALYDGLLSVSSGVDVAALVASIACGEQAAGPSLYFRPARTVASASGTWQVLQE